MMQGQDRRAPGAHAFIKLISSSSVIALFCGSAAAAAQDADGTVAVAPVVLAQAAQNQDARPAEESTGSEAEVIVTGIRASLANAQEIKRRSDTVVDAITAEDIGALPDRSVNEALQRIPGVAITRFASRDNTQHFSVEGSGVVIRGLPYVKGEFNGRDTFRTNAGREIGFEDVAPELVGSVEVYKNLTADLIEGGISGTVNINTRKPFDSNKRLIYLSGDLSYSDLIGKTGPTVTGLFSDQWELGDGSRFGLLLSGTYSKLYQRTDSTYLASPFERFTGTRTFNAGSPYESTLTDTFPVPAGLDQVYAPQGAGVRNMEFERERTGLSAAAQFATADDGLVVTASFLRAQGRVSWKEHTIEPNVWYGDANATFPAPGTSYEFDGNGVFVRGSITRPGGPHEGNIPGGGGYGVLTNFMNGGIFTTFSNRGNYVDYTTDDYSLNLKWAPSDRLRLSFDAQYVDAKADEVDVIIDTATWSNMSLDLTGKIPQVGFSIGQMPDGTTPDTAAYFANPNSIYFRDAFSDRDDNEGEEWAFRADAEYDVSDSGFLRRIRIGGRYSDRDQVVRNNGYNNWGAPSETWTPGGPVTFAAIDPSYYELYTFPNFFRGKHATPPTAPFLAGNVAEEYDRFQDLLRAVNARGQGGYTPLEDRACATVNTYFCPSEVYRNSERTIAAYIRLDFHADTGGDSFVDGNIGLRYVNTRDVAFGSVTAPLRTSILPDTFPDMTAYCDYDHEEVPAVCRLAPQQREAALAFANGASYPYPAEQQFDHWLPSLNIRFQLNPKLQFRFAASRAISRPDFGQLRANITVTPGTSAGGGLFFQASPNANPYLRPTEATQFDLTAEWYFSRVGSLTGTLFYKKLKNIINPNGQTVFDLTNAGQTFPIVLNGPENLSGSADIKGVEVAYQQTFDFLPGALGGLGVQATYTYVKPGKVPNPTAGNGPGDGARPPGEVNALYGALPLQGLSNHNFNLSAFYDRAGLYARVAYSWRSEYLATVRDCCFPWLPTFVEDSGQMDGSIFYTVNDNLKLGIQGTNLLNELTRVSMGVGVDDKGEIIKTPQRAFVTDRRISVVARLSF